MKYIPRLLAAASVLATVATSACTPTIDNRGNLPTPEALAQVKPGQSTEDDVQALLGTPSTTMNYGEEVWHYISDETKSVAFFTPRELKRKVVSIYFGKDGKVTRIATLGLKDGESVTPISRETPTAGKELTLLDQLLGNVGRFSKDAKGK